MRIPAVLVLGGIVGLLGCAESQPPVCDSEGTFVSAEGADYCVYSVTSPIVIEGGFECPAAMRFELQLDTHRICGTRAFEGHTPPPALCIHLPEMCEGGFPPAVGMHDSGMPTQVPTTWTTCDERAIEDARTGDRCTPQFSGCGSSGGCSASFALCDPAGTVAASELEVLDCVEPEPEGEEEPVFSGAADCQLALAQGHSFDACDGQFMCARPTEDACCLEYALCNAEGPQPIGILMRYQFCEPGCEFVEPDTRLQPVSDCSAFANEQTERPEELRRVELGCEGDFICWGDQDLTSGEGADVDLSYGWLRWCSNGIVHGQHSTISNVFIPSGPATP